MLSKRLFSLRDKNNLTQKQMAEIVGVKRETYKGWENNYVTIPFEHLYKFSNYFKISIDYLTGLSDNKKNIKDSNLNKTIISKRLKQIRLENNMSLRDVGKMLETSHSVIEYYENGKTLILTSFIIDYAKKTNTSIDWICGISDKKNLK